MAQLTTSLKIKISLSIIWLIISVLIGMVFAGDSYSSSKLLVFLGITIVLNLPSILFWLGLWIWGDGYLWRFLSHPFRPIKIPTKIKPTSQVYPWRRFFGRVFDYWWWSYVLAVLLVTIWPEIATSKAMDNQAVWSILGAFTFIFIEPLFITTLGTTPTKWMLGIKVCSSDGKKLNLSQAFTRSVQVWAKGLAFGIPIVNWFTLAKAQDYLKKNQTTEWDKVANSVVIITPPHWLGIAMLISMICYFPYTIYQNQQAAESISRFENYALKLPETRQELLQNHLSQVADLLNEQFSPTNLPDISTFRDKRNRLIQAQQSSDATLAKLQDSYSNFENSIAYYDLPENYKASLLAQYYPAKNRFMDKARQLFETQKQMLQVYSQMLDLLEMGSYEVSDNTLIFQHDDELQKYNNLIKRLSSLADTEQKSLSEF